MDKIRYRLTGQSPMMWKYYGQQRPPFAETPPDGHESVWDYPRPPQLSADRRRIRVQSGNRIVADTTRAYRVLETASPPTFYLPPDEIDTDLLQPCPGQSFCEWKGRAGYWALVDNPDQVIGWHYPEPSKAFAAITGYFSFYPGRIICFVDDERVQPQPGEFYGGWVTSELTGPFKGEPGTGHW